jgi:hypothetical protein
MVGSSQATEAAVKREPAEVLTSLVALVPGHGAHPGVAGALPLEDHGEQPWLWCVQEQGFGRNGVRRERGRRPLQLVELVDDE